MRGLPPLLRGVELATRCHDAAWLLDPLKQLRLGDRSFQAKAVPRYVRSHGLMTPLVANDRGEDLLLPGQAGSSG